MEKRLCHREKKQFIGINNKAGSKNIKVNKEYVCANIRDTGYDARYSGSPMTTYGKPESWAVATIG